MKEKKKIDKTKTKEIIKKVLHVVGYVSIGAWVLFGLLVGCSYASQGVRSQDKQENNVLVKRNAPINNVVYDYVYDIDDIDDIYTSSYVNNDYGYYYTKYKATADVTLYSIYTDGSYLINMGVSNYTFIHTLSDNLRYPYGVDNNVLQYDLIFNLLSTESNGRYNNLSQYYPVFEGYTIGDITIYFEEDSSHNLVPNLSIQRITASGDESTLTLRGGRFGNDVLFYGVGQHYRFLKYLFSGEFYYSRILKNNSVPTYYDRFIYLFNQNSINNVYAHTDFDYDSLSWLPLYFNQTNINALYGGYVLSFTNTQTNTDLIFDVLYGDLRLNGSYYHQLRLVYSLVPTNYSGLRLIDALGNTNDISINGNIEYIRYLKYIDLYNTYTGRNEHLCDFAYDVYSNVDTSGTTPVYEDWIVYNKDFSQANNKEFYIRSIIPYYAINLESQQTNYVYFDTTLLQNTNYSLFDGGLNYLSITQYSLNYHDYSNFVDSEGVTWIQNSFTLISFGLEGLWGFLGIYILPGITIGTLILTPLLITMFLILLRIFKAH